MRTQQTQRTSANDRDEESQLNRDVEAYFAERRGETEGCVAYMINDNDGVNEPLANTLESLKDVILDRRHISDYAKKIQETYS